MKLEVLSAAQVRERCEKRTYPAQSSYLAMYSSQWQGIVTDPSLMLIPVDDHLVHRGDGVFEALKMIQGRIFLLDEHLARLQSSAKAIGLTWKESTDELKEILFQTIKAAKTPNALLRLFVGRGPGAFTTNPYDSIGAQFYFMVTTLKPLPEEKYTQGVKIGRSAIPTKDSWLAQLKTCNYLPNVLMKKESVDRQLDFTIGFDGNNFMAESSTENIILLDKNKNLIRPRLNGILKGTTMMRTFELAQKLKEQKIIADILERDISEAELQSAQEVMMAGTTLDVLPVTSYESQKIGSGEVGPVAKELLKLLREDQLSGPKTTLVS